jgi:hypothetical protein
VRRRGARKSATTDDARTAHPNGTPAVPLTIDSPAVQRITVRIANDPAIPT